MAGRLSAMISSTARDLPAHRKEVGEACLRQGVFPVMMEHLPASDADAIEASLRLVDQSDVYLGVMAHRYGYVPAGQAVSITEMEYDRAVQCNRPRLIFLMHDDHPVRAADVEKGEGAARLERFKERLRADRVAGFFKSPEDLRGQVIEALGHVRPRNLGAFHRDSTIPAPPMPCIAHPYTLLQTRGLVGREAELALLDQWAAAAAPVLTLVALGGMGKSALTWTWFHDRAPEQLRPLAGRLWWSFYESDASYENFVLCALAYVSGQDRDSLRDLPAHQREARLLAALDHEPYLIVLDGLERILHAYARMDAARQDDDLDQRTANALASRHQLRKATDPRAGAFLRRLAQVRASRVLISSRLYPADLQTATGQPLPGCRAHFLTGLADDDALALWRALGVGGSRDALLGLFRRFDNYPLLIRALAGEVARYRRAPGDFDRWRHNHPDFDPSRLELVQVKSHVLAFALGGLDEPARKVLHTVAAFRMPANYDTLAALLVGQGKAFAAEQGLDAALTELEDRGLLGWDRAANRYDLHPVVRGVAWEGLDGQTRTGVYQALRAHFEAVPGDQGWERVARVEDLAPAIELYNTLINLGRHAEALELMLDRLYQLLSIRLAATRQLAELLEALLPGGDSGATLLGPLAVAWARSSLGVARQRLGQPAQAVDLLRQALALYEPAGDTRSIGVNLVRLATALRLCGRLREAEAAARRALILLRAQGDIFEEAYCLRRLGVTLAARNSPEADRALGRVFRVAGEHGLVEIGGEMWGPAWYAMVALWRGQFQEARALAERAWIEASAQGERDFSQAARLQGMAALGLGDLQRADDWLHNALERARSVNSVEEELLTLVGLAELRRRQGNLADARALLEDVWEPAERGPYPLIHADARNVLAQLERDAGSRAAAIEAATRACRLAWCDGPPFAYHWGLQAARTHLAALGAAGPDDLPPFEEARYAPLPVVELSPGEV